MSAETTVQNEKKYLANLELEKEIKERKERERQKMNEKLSGMSVAEYIAERMGKPHPITDVDVLSTLSTEDYIKARKE